MMNLINFKGLEKLNKDFNCSIVQDNFEFPLVRPLGNFSFASATSSSHTVFY